MGRSSPASWVNTHKRQEHFSICLMSLPELRLCNYWGRPVRQGCKRQFL
jgi:hypothetical protein